MKKLLVSLSLVLLSMNTTACIGVHVRTMPDPQSNYVFVTNKTSMDSVRVSFCGIQVHSLNRAVDTAMVQVHYRNCGPEAMLFAEAFRYGRKVGSSNAQFHTAYDYLLNRNGYNNYRQPGQTYQWTLTDNLFRP